ncbi:MurR/RpiR family transcriptional regulator [Diaminobutyricibacter sp. McL0618]|uniref:MurR/RpiR family transcriptional regulator n=1 Tax=Leifsonia sp. McL0618 TaxID=3415677 RepID=UPI003CEE73F5
MPINTEIFARMGELSPAEKKVARALLSNYPTAGLESAASLAKAAGTSTPTVLRLVTRLGIGSYPDFQRRLREEISHTMLSPISRTEQAQLAHDSSAPLERAIAEKIALVQALSSSVPPSEFDRAVTALASRARQITVSGGYFTRYFAMLLASQLDQAVPNVEFVSEPFGHDISKMLRLGAGSIAVILDFRRYELVSKQAADLARRQGATVIVITDQELSPAVEFADIVLPVHVDGVPFDSVVGITVLVEALVEGVLHASGQRGLDRMKAWEESVHIARSYPSAIPLEALANDTEEIEEEG